MASFAQHYVGESNPCCCVVADSFSLLHSTSLSEYVTFIHSIICRHLNSF